MLLLDNSHITNSFSNLLEKILGGEHIEVKQELEILYKTLSQVGYNTKVKIYPNGLHKTTVCTNPIFKPVGYEDAKFSDKNSKPRNMENETRSDSLKRTNEKIFDIAILNKFDYFITWTLNDLFIERDNAKLISQKAIKFLNNKQQRNGWQYLVIPEYHSDGKNIHMHGFIQGDVKTVDSGKKTTAGQVIYNMPQWKYGFSTAIKLDDDYCKLASYITKYITKDTDKIFGKRYYSSQGLIKEPVIKLLDTDYRKLDSKEYYIEQAKLSFKYFDSLSYDDFTDIIENYINIA